MNLNFHPDEFWFEIVQGGIVVACGSGPDQDAVTREAVHYAAQYLQDGPVQIRGTIKSPALPPHPDKREGA